MGNIWKNYGLSLTNPSSSFFGQLGHPDIDRNDHEASHNILGRRGRNAILAQDRCASCEASSQARPIWFSCL